MCIVYVDDSCYHYNIIVWCTVEVQTNRGTKEYVASSKVLQTESGEPVNESDLTFGNTVIWRCRGTPYDAIVLDIHSELQCIIYCVTHIVILL